jgi:hypothetical protein
VFRDAGKSVDSIPWILMIGKSGVGKTELLRRGFSPVPGLQDRHQGAGGTVNIHWWFTNRGVYLDIAGRLAFSQGEEWECLHECLRSSGRRRPFDGVIVAHSAEHLLLDTRDRVEADARSLRLALSSLRPLMKRDEVNGYFFLTKCDLIFGFVEFFLHLSSTESEAQILGWTNFTSPRDSFREDSFQIVMDALLRRLRERRSQLLFRAWMAKYGEHHTSQSVIDSVDSLFEFPENLAGIIRRVSELLKGLFSFGGDNPRPLPLRSVFFTSARQEVEAHDLKVHDPLEMSRWICESREGPSRPLFISDAEVKMAGDIKTVPREVQSPRMFSSLMSAVAKAFSSLRAPPRSRLAFEAASTPESPAPRHASNRPAVPFAPYSGLDSFAFISHAREDKEIIEPWLEILAKAGIRAWWDAGITPGRLYNEVIAERLDRCQAFVVFVTPHSIDSEWVQDEIDFAKQRKKTRITVVVGNVDVPQGLLLLLGRSQRINTASDRSETAGRELVEAVSTHLYPAS